MAPRRGRIRERVYFGGPNGAQAPFATGCSQGTGFVPTLSIGGDPIIGPGNKFEQQGASPNSASVLLVGFPQLNAVALNPCFVHLNSSLVVFATTTDALGYWINSNVSLVNAPGVTIGFQAVTVSAGSGNALEASNTISVLLGW